MTNYYSGETLTVTVSAFDKVTKFPVSAPMCTVNFYAPPKNPELNVADRVVDFSFQAVYDANQRLYVAYVDTSGWAGGTWYYQGILNLNTFKAWEYSTVSILA